MNNLTHRIILLLHCCVKCIKHNLYRARHSIPRTAHRQCENKVFLMAFCLTTGDGTYHVQGSPLKIRRVKFLGLSNRRLYPSLYKIISLIPSLKMGEFNDI